MKTRQASFWVILLSLATCAAAQVLTPNAVHPDSNPSFTLTSTTFTNGSTLPISMIYSDTVNGSNACSLNGAPGGNQSPELSWADAPKGTVSFVVTAFDDTASFTHWGMYNIAGAATGLPENAGVAGSTYGSQIYNDFYVGEYDGPCPPAGYRPYAHRYVFTVYALDYALSLPSSVNFPATAETLYQALIRAGKNRHILASSSIIGFYSTTPVN